MPAVETRPPPGSRILSRLPACDFHDAWATRAGSPELSAIGQFKKAAAATPRWVDACMAMRNLFARCVGLKDLGLISAVDPTRPDDAYRPGDRLGIFTVIENHPDELLVGDHDRHLEVVLSVHCRRDPEGAVITVTTVVHVHSWLGRLYMLPVAPMHRRIVPAVLQALEQRLGSD
jgi:hypothetical protein